MHGSEAATIRYKLAADAWLGGHLGKPAWRVDHDAAGGSLAGLRGRGPAFAWAKVDAAKLVLLRDLVANDFSPVDVAVTFEGPPPREAIGSEVRFARPADRDAVTQIARSEWRYSRFHLDPLIPAAVANEIKAEWVANFFSGRRGDGMIVGEADGEVAGFLQLLWAGDTLVIDLIGVAGTQQRKGIARRMIGFAAVNGDGDRPPARIRVGTQVANTPSVRLYESLGLRLIGAQYVVHYHAQ